MTTVFAALMAAGVAVAGHSELKAFSAKFEQGGSISFQLDKREWKVRDIYIDRMHPDCDAKNARLSYRIRGSTPVLDDRSFAVRSKDGDGGEAVVRGRFSRRFKRAEGTARVYGTFLIGGSALECDSGKQKYVAK